MKLDALDKLHEVAETAYRADLAVLHEIAAEEAEIRNEIAALIDEIARADAQDALSAMPLRNIGGDVLWRGWVGRKRAQLNMRLATTLVRKQQAMARLTLSFGKKKALADLREGERRRLKRKKEKHRLLIDQEQMIAAAVRTREDAAPS